MRCAAVYELFSSAAGAAGLWKDASAFKGVVFKFTMAAASLEKPKSTFVETQIKKMYDMYAERAQTAKARTGNWSDDNIIAADGTFCRQFGK
jgi:hypothetical protein